MNLNQHPFIDFLCLGPGLFQDRVRTVDGETISVPVRFRPLRERPGEEMLREPSRWRFFMSGAELTSQHNAGDEIKCLDGSPRVITRDRLPNFTPAC